MPNRILAPAAQPCLLVKYLKIRLFRPIPPYALSNGTLSKRSASLPAYVYTNVIVIIRACSLGNVKNRIQAGRLTKRWGLSLVEYVFSHESLRLNREEKAW